jgi:two-component system, chemotaxis family, CheB/CheR fusion protein
LLTRGSGYPLYLNSTDTHRLRGTDGYFHLRPMKSPPGENSILNGPRVKPDATSNFPVVAIGASAGGLVALEAFFRNMPSDSGMAFVVAMHLSAEHESQLAQILARYTVMPVIQVSSDTEVLANHVYVIAPRKQFSFKGGKLRVSVRGPAPLSGVIDQLFLSMADSLQRNAIGIVLSGNGADGTDGLKAIKERGGTILAQDPGDAEVGSMPQSIIATSLVDFVVPAAEMPAHLITLHDRGFGLIQMPEQEGGGGEDEPALGEILARLHQHTGHDFTYYKRSTLLRQIGRRLLVLHADGLSDYARRIQENDSEVETLFRNLLISVTRFFREPAAFRVLQQEVIPRLFTEKAVSAGGIAEAVRVWVAGCATGEETYSVAMLLAEHRNATGSSLPFQIIATDIDSSALAVARSGRYPEAAVAGMSPERLKRFFVRREGEYLVHDDLRSMVVFADHDITRDTPFARMDLISCRNVLMYYEPEMQRRIVEACAYSIRPGGCLFLGSAESIGRATDHFTALSRKHGLFQRTDSQRVAAPLKLFPTGRAFPESATPGNKDGDAGALAATEDTGRLADFRDVGKSGDSPGSDISTDRLILANQEMQSLNEELRSMMEELEVAKEEMQSLNEELMTVNQELQNKIEEHRRTNTDLHILIESTNMATLFLDQHLRVLLYTPESTKLYNLLPIDIGRPLEHLSHCLTYHGVLEDARHVLAHSEELDREVEDHSGRWYSMRAMPYPECEGAPTGVVLTFADITAQKHVERATTESFSLSFHAGPMPGCIITREDHRVLDVNRLFEKMTGYSREEIVGRPAAQFGLPIFDALDSKEEVTETRIRSRFGHEHELIVSSTATQFEGQPCYLSLFHDATERKRLEREILRVSDREQRRIGVDLHDGLGAHLTGIALMTRGLSRNLKNGRNVDAAELDEIAKLLSEGVEQARTLAQGLNPFVLEVRGLNIALRELAENVTAQTHIACTFQEEGEPVEITSDQSMHLFRITQEAVANASRHAEATEITITLSRRKRHSLLRIRDNGKGFVQAEPQPNGAALHGMGLSIMRYRADLIGARLKITTAPGQGTSITCSFPNPS